MTLPTPPPATLIIDRFLIICGVNVNKVNKILNLYIFTFTRLSEDMFIAGKLQKFMHVMQAYVDILIGIAVANFLITTNRAVKGIQLAEECLIFLNNTVLRENTTIFNRGYCHICYLFSFAYGYYIFDYTRAIEWGEKTLEAMVQLFGEFSDQVGTATMMLALWYLQQLKYEKAKELFEKALRIKQETGDRDSEATCYRCLGVLCYHVGQYHNSNKYIEKALEIRKEIGDKMGIADCYSNLAIAFESLGQYDKAMEYIDKSLLIRREIGDRKGVAKDYICKGKVCHSVGEYADGRDFAQKALAIQKEIGDREGQAESHSSFATFFSRQGQCAKAVQCLRESLLISKETGRKVAEALCYTNLGCAYTYFGEFAEAKENIEKALKISKETGNVQIQWLCHLLLGLIMMFQGNAEESISNLFSSIQHCEDLRSSLGDNDPFKVSLLDKHFAPYQTLSQLFCDKGDHVKALYVLELGRARALTELMSTQYFAGKQFTIDPQSWMGIEGIIKKGSNFTCLYISYVVLDIYLWILDQKQSVNFRHIKKDEAVSTIGPVEDLNAFLRNPPVRGCQKLLQGHCEDRSMFPLVACSSSQEDRVAALRPFELDEDDQEEEPSPTLELLYKIFITPVADLLDEPEILIVPDRSLYKIPFAALKDENGKYLSETFKIRIVPSLTTLKLIQERPATQFNDRSVLIVGDPDVSYVSEFSQLSFARKEAKMIAEWLGVQPLLGCQATKQAVLESMHSASLIHFAAHGDAERGEIVLAPVQPVNRPLHKDDYVLTTADVSEVRLTAKLVVLSCCHSALGHIRAEGVVGIARAFLGSGARSVLVALWAIEDEATEQFMGRFYEHLVRGESASESLHQAMKWMRENGFPEVWKWAPFMLIGDNVTFDFRK